MKLSCLVLLTCLLSVCAAQQNTLSSKQADTTRWSPVVLPGSGLRQHDMFYAGENDILSMFIIKKGNIVWSYTHPGKGEISDAQLLSNGDVLFAHQFGVTKISADKKIRWNYDAPAGTEIHTAQAIGKNHVVFIQNGKPAKLMVVNTTTKKVEKEIEIPVGNPESIHGQFRHARLTDAGTIMVAHMDMGKIVEYNVNGQEVWSYQFGQLWSAVPLKNGHILISSGSKKTVTEINRKGDTIWQFSDVDLPPGYFFAHAQLAYRLDNGNTIINNWASKGNGTIAQAIEVDKHKKLLWVLRSWKKPDIGRSTTIQLLDKSIPENVHFGYFK